MKGVGRCAASAIGFAAVVAGAVAATGCSTPPPEPIRFEGRAIVVENLTAEEWRDVEVWLNDHYRVTRPRMPPGERFSIPLSSFVAGFGQRFDASRQSMRGVEVTASAPGGRVVKLKWGTGRRR